MRTLSLTTLLVSGVLCGVAFAITSASAQTAAPGCGPVAYSAAEQKYVGVPCAAETPKAEAGKPAPCGPVAYSAAEQRYVGVPCTTAK